MNYLLIIDIILTFMMLLGLLLVFVALKMTGDLDLIVKVVKKIARRCKGNQWKRSRNSRG